MTDDEQTRAIALVAEYLSIRETAALWFDLGAAEIASSTAKLGAMFDEMYAEMDAEFWQISEHYDGGWDILREASI
jgi:hypothetical protein